MPAIVEISFDNEETIVDCVLPDTEYCFSYTEPESLEQRIMRISCMADDGYTKVEIGSTPYSPEEFLTERQPRGLTDMTEEIWEVFDGTHMGLVAVTHTALMVSDFQAIIY